MRTRKMPFPQQWRGILERKMPYYRGLTSAEQAELRGHILVFLSEKRFEGCGGLEITDEIRVTIAAQACLLLVNRESDYFPAMQSIFVYPGRFNIRDARRMPDGTVLETDEEYTGESWSRGPVVLAWDEVMESAAEPDDGYNVVIHEFAHQLDCESGSENGSPVMDDRSMRESWGRVMRREYDRLQEDIEHKRPHLIDEYGASSPAEFFAVVAETFFEMPRALKRRHPELYGLLKSYFKQDPALRRTGKRKESSPG